MLIESLIKPTQRTERVVNIHGRNYTFTEVPNQRGRFVAEVDDKVAQETLLKNTKVYREFTDAIGPSLSKAPAKPAAPTPATQPKPATQPATPPATPPPAADAKPGADTGDAGKSDGEGEQTPPGDTNDEITGKAQALLSCTPVAIKKQLEKNCPSLAVIDRSIAIEAAADKPRDQVLAALRGAASAMQA